MKTIFTKSHVLLAGASLLLSVSSAAGRSYGVSAQSAGRGTKYTTQRGGEAYVGPHGVAAQGANGRTAAATPRGAAVAGPNGAAVSGRYGAAAVGPNGAAVSGRYGAAAVGPNGGVAVAARPLPTGYIRTVPSGYRPVVYRGYNCYFVGGIYYRAVFYQGATVYVIVS